MAIKGWEILYIRLLGALVRGSRINKLGLQNKTERTLSSITEGAAIIASLFCTPGELQRNNCIPRLQKADLNLFRIPTLVSEDRGRTTGVRVKLLFKQA